MVSSDPWLSPEQQLVWRRWVALDAHLPAALTRQLQRDSGLSLSDFDVLVQLSEAPEQRVRPSDLASALSWERSRVSHHVKRMQGRGLVAREDCEDDGRGAFVVLTPAGRTAFERAAPEHARTVGALVFAALSESDLAVLARVFDDVLSRVAAAPTTEAVPSS